MIRRWRDKMPWRRNRLDVRRRRLGGRLGRVRARERATDELVGRRR
jgi:hypothetical protein